MEGRSGIDPGDATLTFFRSIADDVHHYISRLTGGDVQLTEDIVQDTFIALFRQRSAFPDVAIGAGWVMTTARNRLIDHVRSQQRERTRTARHHAGEEAEARPFDYDLVSAEQARWLLRCLPEQERLALALHTVDQLSLAEVATLLGRSVDATTSLVARARRRLRNVVEELRDE
jgi:RNA polymerase sigma-70 factor (ECF subfamily)